MKRKRKKKNHFACIGLVSIIGRLGLTRIYPSRTSRHAQHLTQHNSSLSQFSLRPLPSRSSRDRYDTIASIRRTNHLCGQRSYTRHLMRKICGAEGEWTSGGYNHGRSSDPGDSGSWAISPCSRDSPPLHLHRLHGPATRLAHGGGKKREQ